MKDLFLSIGNTLSAALGEIQMLTMWESVAVILALAYLVLAMRQNIWCWAAAFFSTAIYTLLFWKVSLLMESVLNVYYMAMAVYGYRLWKGGGQQNSALQVESWGMKTHLILICVTTLVAFILGWLMATYTEASFPYLDAATSCFAVMTTYLVAKKVLENWLYWVVIDLVSIYLYMSKGLMLTSVLFVFYVGLAVWGYFMWRQQYMQNLQCTNAATA
ncbi:nicotinamide riboside transporter PnuC [Shewanella gelidii]|uniref:Nicotinamide riboside transporter PnuC n=1 Tax=Shewanella gelidii TaxID=1642821 RepID=A0A917JTV0_9GAMM|nr:nicotinamide riboside transporter PnuC [Shewanella gelidii]MCL1098343.1 nicotinamide riboside transporter PnuC [Shewanella gelidii]GGI84505.1 nicotinamide mononucleotide transporter [Shewanella gelidii]